MEGIGWRARGDDDSLGGRLFTSGEYDDDRYRNQRQEIMRIWIQWRSSEESQMIEAEARAGQITPGSTQAVVSS
ncbi:hypothetical protein Dda_8617 [Drechslerella dactyloides]|uniref:Uncharacterized protein n=1 Tax=Drechslerella dactyloides TaxID=74499 RepID=A0AAD6NFT8_DREDA|nr:hypothetical protein Dda_8617 [Drechslerella dactyloides]